MSRLFLFFLSLSFCAAASAADQMRSFEQSRVDALVASIQVEIESGKYQRAPLLLKAAQEGNGKACNLLGWMFDNGKGVRRDSSKALRWFESCAGRSPLAAYNAGVIYAEGREVKKDDDRAAQYFELAWAHGGSSFHEMMSQIPIRLGFYYYGKQNFDKAWEWAEISSEFNSRYGKYLVGRLIVEKHGSGSESEAIPDLNEAIEAYSHPAASLLAWCYASGRFGKKDMFLAHEYAVIAQKMSATVGGQDWGGYLNDTDKKNAELKASQWISEHKAPAPMNFSGTLNGSEEQFRK